MLFDFIDHATRNMDLTRFGYINGRIGPLQWFVHLNKGQYSVCLNPYLSILWGKRYLIDWRPDKDFWMLDVELNGKRRAFFANLPRAFDGS